MAIHGGMISASVALAVLLAGLLSFLIPERSYACAPNYIGPPLEELERADSVFRGKVISTAPLERESASEETIYQFMVTTVWKGPLAEKRTITARDFEPACGRQFSRGEEYLVYSGDGYTDWFSTRTRPISDAAEDLAQLGEGQMPIPGTNLPPLETATEPENGGGCGISPNMVDLSIVGLIVGIVWFGLGRRRFNAP